MPVPLRLLSGTWGTLIHSEVTTSLISNTLVITSHSRFSCQIGLPLHHWSDIWKHRLNFMIWSNCLYFQGRTLLWGRLAWNLRWIKLWITYSLKQSSVPLHSTEGSKVLALTLIALYLNIHPWALFSVTCLGPPPIQPAPKSLQSSVCSGLASFAPPKAVICFKCPLLLLSKSPHWKSGHMHVLHVRSFASVVSNSLWPYGW